ncbi:hypothetical protein L1987_18541 [Smallanthus sonchifolius]|uniref:Uncharacterized protein n=1 Tax=Smallanthus sonchifolius TaxID=185202 RepID=A0ACB9J227_9ASTR|nr:hypothetical protein L1987_18541 [Smallanthus sonchifolius]
MRVLMLWYGASNLFMMLLPLGWPLPATRAMELSIKMFSPPQLIASKKDGVKGRNDGKEKFSFTDLTVLRALSTTSFDLCSKFNAQAAQKPYSST